MTKRFFPMAFYVKPKDLGERSIETQIHKTRDGIAAQELGSVLYAHGFEYGNTLLNVPRAMHQMNKQTSVSLGKSDLLLLATRPPLDDTKPRQSVPAGESAKTSARPIFGSGKEPETSVLAELKFFFDRCDRSKVALSANCHPDDPALMEIDFAQNQGGHTFRFGGQVRTSTTVGYLASVPSVEREGCRLLNAFGMGGTETLWFSFLLRTYLRTLLDEAITTPDRRLWLVEFKVPDWVPFPVLMASESELDPQIHLAV